MIFLVFFNYVFANISTNNAINTFIGLTTNKLIYCFVSNLADALSQIIQKLEFKYL